MVRLTVERAGDDLGRRDFAVAYAFGVQERRRRTSGWRGRWPRPLRHGASTANGSGTSIRFHTSGSWASSDPWCGTLKTDACPAGRSPLARIRRQPGRERSEPSSTEKFRRPPRAPRRLHWATTSEPAVWTARRPVFEARRTARNPGKPRRPATATRSRMRSERICGGWRWRAPASTPFSSVARTRDGFPERRSRRR